MNKKLLWIFALSSILSNYSQASSLIEDDWIKDSGDKKITRDIRTGLDWLDVTETLHISARSILSGYGDWLNNGFRYATMNEVYSLMESANFTENMDREGSVSGGNGIIGSINLFTLEQLIGYTTYSNPYIDNNNPGQLTIYGTFEYSFVDANGNTSINHPMTYFTTIRAQNYVARVLGGGVNNPNSLDTYISDPVGNFLVREAATVPTPATILLMLAAIPAFRLTQKSKSQLT